MKLFVNEDTRTVVAKITNVREQMFASLDKITLDLSYLPAVRHFVYQMPNTIIGKAQCSLHDDFNIEMGVELARSRAIATHSKLRSLVFAKFRDYVINSIYFKLVSKVNDCDQTLENKQEIILSYFEE